MQVKFFTVSIFSGDEEEEKMNKFLRSHKVIDIKQEFVNIDNSHHWCFCIRYILGEVKPTVSSKKTVDYKAVLDENAFLKFTKLREYRKQISKDNAIPAYAVFTDAELSEISKLNEITSKNIETIKGIGVKKSEKYGNVIAEMFNNETQGKLN